MTGPNQPQSGSEPLGAWSALTRDRSLIAVFLVSLVAVLIVFGPFLDALVLASATVVVSWPLYERIRAMTRQRVYLAAGITTVAVVLLVLVPVTALGAWFLQEAAALVQQGVEVVREGTFRDTVEQWVWTLELPGEERLSELLGQHVDVVSLIVEPVQRSAVSIGQGVAKYLPDLVGMVLGAGLDVFVFLFAVVTLYAEGPRLLRAAGRLSPLRPEYHRRLFEVFREFSTNLVLGALTTASVQSVVATLSFAIAGAPNLVLLGLLTAVGAFIPVVGSATVWVPVAVWVGIERGWGWGAFVAVWNASLTASVDNVLRPLLLRGRSPIHPLPIFLSVLGGIYWLGPAGGLLGPVSVAVLVALYRIWTEELEAQGIRFPDATPMPATRADLGWETAPSTGMASGGVAGIHSVIGAGRATTSPADHTSSSSSSYPSSSSSSSISSESPSTSSGLSSSSPPPGEAATEPSSDGAIGNPSSSSSSSDA